MVLQKLKKFIIDKKVIYALILLCYTVFMFYTISEHELWRDEVQAWTLARDLSFVDLIKQMQIEGHPCLWHLVLMPFAKLGFPVITLSFISAAFMLATAYIILYKSPFHPIVKVLLVCSSPFIYFISIISRVYCLIPFLMSLICLVYPNRKQRPYLYATLIAFLVNTHVIVSIFAAMLGLHFLLEMLVFNKETLKEKKKYIIALFIMCLGAIICFFQINESLLKNSIVEDLNTYDVVYSDNEVENFFKTNLYGAVEELSAFTGAYYYINMPRVHTILLVIGIVALVLLAFTFKHASLVIISYLFQFLVCAFIWFSIPQRTVLIIFYLMVAAWMLFYDHQIKNKKKIYFYAWEVVIGIVCLLSIRYGYNSLKYDINENVSGGKQTANYIEEKLPSDSRFIVPVDYVATTIAGYIDKNIFYSIVRDEYITYANWDEYWRKQIDIDVFEERMYNYGKEYSNVYILYSKNFLWLFDEFINDMEKENKIKPIYESPDGLNSEWYTIYKINDKFYKEYEKTEEVESS